MIAWEASHMQRICYNSKVYRKVHNKIAVHSRSSCLALSNDLSNMGNVVAPDHLEAGCSICKGETQRACRSIRCRAQTRNQYYRLLITHRCRRISIVPPQQRSPGAVFD